MLRSINFFIQDLCEKIFHKYIPFEEAQRKHISGLQKARKKEACDFRRREQKIQKPVGKRVTVNDKSKQAGDIPVSLIHLTLILKVSQDSTEAYDCSICRESCASDSRLVFNPCGHGACSSCVSKLRECHICETVIDGKQKQFE